MNALTRIARYVADSARQASMPAPVVKLGEGSLSPVGGWPWWPARILESYAGAWQSNVTVDQTIVAAYWAVFACATLIAKDISKLYARVVEEQSSGILKPTDLRPVLQRPNHFQTRIEFFFHWMMSQLLQGNTYVLKERNKDGFTVAMYVLCPSLVVPMVAPDGSVFYKLNADNLAGINQTVMVPASEIIHDRMYTLHHPLIGVSPIYACGIAAMQGSAIMDNSTKFFQNMSRPSGMLTAPGAIDPGVAVRLKEAWETNFSAANIGRLAVLGDGLKYEAMTINAHDAQLIEQLKMTGEMIAACYHVPGYKIGVGPVPTVNNTATLNQQYYDQCLQYPLEKMEARLDEGLELRPPNYTQFDLAGLLRMDPGSRYDAHQKGIAAGWKSPNEVRREENLDPVPGGDTVYMQAQNQSLAALSKRDEDAIAGNKDVQAAAMNGAQVSSLQGLLMAAAEGKLPKESLRAAIAAAFPLLSAGEINNMVNPIVEGSVAPEPAPGPAAPAPTDDEPEEDLEEEDVEKLLSYLYKQAPEMIHA